MLIPKIRGKALIIFTDLDTLFCFVLFRYLLDLPFIPKGCKAALAMWLTNFMLLWYIEKNYICLSFFWGFRK